MTQPPPTPTPTLDYDTLVAGYRKTVGGTSSSFQWHKVRDARHPEPTSSTRKRLLRKPVTQKTWKQVHVTAKMRDAYLLLRDRQKTVASLNLPTNSPIPGQVDAALRTFCGLAATITARCTDAYDAATLPEHRQAIELAAQIAAVVDLAQQRDAVIEHIDSASLRRTAQALVADLNAARDHLAADPIDRELEQDTPAS